MLFCPTFRAKSSGTLLVDFDRLSLPSPGRFSQFSCDRPDQLQRSRTPDLEHSRKTAEKGAERPSCKVPAKQPKNSRKNTRSVQNSCFSAVWLPVRLFFGCFPGTLLGGHSAPFSAVFRLFSRSGVRGLCSWSGRS